MFRNVLLAAVSLTALSAPAFAESANPFAGYYGGIHGGAGSFEASGSVSQSIEDWSVGSFSADDSFSNHTSSGLAGGQLGYNAVTESGFLIGVELNASLTNLDSSESMTTSFTDGQTDFDYNATIDGLGLLQGKLGFASEKVAVYGLAGFALASGKIDGSWDTSGNGTDAEGFTGSGTFSRGSSTYNGWTVGAGADVALTEKTSMGISYNYVRLNGDELDFDGTTTYENSATTAASFTVDPQFDAHIVKISLNVKF